MFDSKETLNLEPIIPLTENPQQYLRLREEERQRFAAHAQQVHQAYQERRNNERQQFQQRMSKCPIGLPSKRLSPRTPPPTSVPEFKSPKWMGPSEPKKSSPDSSNFMPKNIRNSSTVDSAQLQFQPQINNFHGYNQQMHSRFPDPRLMAHPYNYYANQKAPQNGYNGPPQFIPGNMQQFNSMIYHQQMQHQQWQAEQLQRQQIEMNELAQRQQRTLNPTHQLPQFSVQATKNCSPQMDKTPNCALTNFWPLQYPYQNNCIAPPVSTNQPPQHKESVLTDLLSKGDRNSLILTDEDDTLALFSTFDEKLEPNQMIHQYLDNISDIQTCNFPQIPTNAQCDNARQKLSSGSIN